MKTNPPPPPELNHTVMSREDMQKLLDRLDKLPTSISALSQVKVADEIAVGQEFELYMLFGGKTTFFVEVIVGDNACLSNHAGAIAMFERRGNGWYDTYIRLGGRLYLPARDGEK